MNTETKKPTVYEYLDSDVDRYGSCLSIHVFENRYSLGNIAVLLAGDHSRLAVDELLEVHFKSTNQPLAIKSTQEWRQPQLLT